MRNHIIRRFSWVVVLSLSLTLAVTGQSASRSSLDSGNEVKPKAKGTDEIEQALAAAGAGSAAEIKSRLFTHNITFFNEEFRAQAVPALPASLHKRRITQSKLLSRVERIFQQTLQLHGRSGKLDLFLFQDDVPSAMLWRGCVLVLSDGLADPLYDGELAGIIAHELGHSYIEDEMADAQRAKDARAMRVVELKCDAVAILSLKLLNYDPALYLRGLRRIQVIIKRKSLSSGIFQSHPELVARAQFSQRFIKALG
jgi:Zn-dependent protease with chaperone function